MSPLESVEDAYTLEDELADRAREQALPKMTAPRGALRTQPCQCENGGVFHTDYDGDKRCVICSRLAR